MFQNTLLISSLWIAAILSYFFINNLWDYLVIDFLWLTPFAVMFVSKHGLSLLVLVLFGLTSDTWIFLYPGITTLSNLLTGVAYLCFYHRLQFEEKITRISIIVLGLIGYKLFSFLLIYLFSQISLFSLYLSLKFWVNFALTVFCCYFAIGGLNWLQSRFKLLDWNK